MAVLLTSANKSLETLLLQYATAYNIFVCGFLLKDPCAMCAIY